MQSTSLSQVDNTTAEYGLIMKWPRNVWFVWIVALQIKKNGMKQWILNLQYHFLDFNPSDSIFFDYFSKKKKVRKTEASHLCVQVLLYSHAKVNILFLVFYQVLRILWKLVTNKQKKPENCMIFFFRDSKDIKGVDITLIWCSVIFFK